MIRYSQPQTKGHHNFVSLFLYIQFVSNRMSHLYTLRRNLRAFAAISSQTPSHLHNPLTHLHLLKSLVSFSIGDGCINLGAPDVLVS